MKVGFRQTIFFFSKWLQGKQRKMEMEFYPKFEANNSCSSEKFKKHYTKMDAMFP